MNVFDLGEYVFGVFAERIERIEGNMNALRACMKHGVDMILNEEQKVMYDVLREHMDEEIEVNVKTEERRRAVKEMAERVVNGWVEAVKQEGREHED